MSFGEFPLEPFSFARSLFTKVRERAEELQNTDLYRGGQTAWEQTAWTASLKLVLKEVGDGIIGCESLYRLTGHDSSEFLLDFVFWHRSEKGEQALLACESEFGNPRDRSRDVQAIGADFDKLLSFKAPIKLMIFDTISSQERESDIITLLTAHMRKYALHTKGELYLFVDFGPKSKIWYVQIPDSGFHPDLDLLSLG